MIVLTKRDLGKGILIGIVSAVLLAIFQIATQKAGISPIPAPVAVAFADKLLGTKLPLPIGLLFHVAYVTFWTVVYVRISRNKMTFLNALWLALALWAILLVVFFPFIGWGFLGLAIGPKLIVAALVIHLLFAVLTWAFSKWAFKSQLNVVKAH